MKIRQGFVSNSSSSSFILDKHLVTEEQIRDLLDYCSQPIGIWGDSWDIQVTDDKIRGYTLMRNCIDDDEDLEPWMSKNGFPMHLIKWDSGYSIN